MLTTTLQTSSNTGYIAQLNSHFEVEQLTRFVGSASDSSKDVLWAQYNETSSIYGIVKSDRYIYFFEYKVTDTMYVNTSSFSSWVAYRYSITFSGLLSYNLDLFSIGMFYSTMFTNGSDRDGIIFWKANDSNSLAYMQMKETGYQYFGAHTFLNYGTYVIKVYMFLASTNGCKCFRLNFSFYSVHFWIDSCKNLVLNCFLTYEKSFWALECWFI